MPCSLHNHTPWPTSGVHTLRIEACERECGWCDTRSTSATNLRSHARKHLSNPNATALHQITIFSGRAGRKRVALSTQLLSKQQHNDNLHTKSGTSNPRDYAPDRVTTVFERVDDEHTELSKAGSSYLANASLHGNHGFQAKRGQDIDDVSKHKASIKTNDHSAQAAWMSSDSPGQERTIKNYRDVRAEIDDLEKSIRKCSHRLRTFAANLPTHCPPVHRYGVESFITWCSLSSSSMLGLHEYFEEAHDGRNLEPAFNYRHGVEGVASDRFTTANIAAPIMDESHAWPETIPQDNNLNHVGVDRPNVEWEHLKSPLQHRMEPLKHQQLPSIDTLLNDRQIYEINGPRAETAPFVQLRYDSTARSVNYTRTGRISKAKKGLKVYSCECGRSYTRAEHLRRHQQNHTSDQALVCEYPSCGKVFYRPDLLLRHQERHQESNGEPASPETTSPIHQSSSSHWLDLGSPTNVFDFFSDPLLDPPECRENMPQL